MASTEQLSFPDLEKHERPLRWRVGLIALATDHTSEQDFARLNPSRELGVYVNRVAFTNPTNKENLLAMSPRLTDAAALILPGERLDAVAYSCTAASALIGDEAVRQAIGAAKPDTPVVTPTAAAIRGFEALGAHRISVLTPYTVAVTDPLVAYLEREGGIEVAKASCLGITDDREIAKVAPTAIVEAARAALDRRSDALFISCTALRAVPVIEAIEDELGLPVVTSNQAMFWQTLRRAGCDLTVAGYGRLLAGF